MTNPDAPRISQNEELPSFVKLAMMYMGIMAGMSLIGLVLFLIASSGETPGTLPRSVESWSTSIIILISLIAIPLMSLGMMKERLRIGGYLAFSALVISLFAPAPSQLIAESFAIIYWLAIPNAIVGILLARDLKKLR